MEEPHQRKQSGKLRQALKPGTKGGSVYHRELEEVTVGIENTTEITNADIDEEYASYTQTPIPLTDTQVRFLQDIVTNLGLVGDVHIDREWRRTWNIGTWCIGKTFCLSSNIIQPNICNSWATIKNASVSSVEQAVRPYKEVTLERSTIDVTSSNNLVQVKGRWVPHVVDSMIKVGSIAEENIEITYVNSTQSRLFFWLILGPDHEYMCTPTSDTINILLRHIPSWSFGMIEVSAGGSLSIKLKKTDDNLSSSERHSDNASQISITNTGWVQYVGRPETLGKLYGALAHSIRATVHSPQLPAFINSMQYRYLSEEII